jgi:hypothetical protein
MLIGFALREHTTVMPIPDATKLVPTKAFDHELLINPTQILWIEVGDGGPSSSAIHFIGGMTLPIDYPPMQLIAK